MWLKSSLSFPLLLGCTGLLVSCSSSSSTLPSLPQAPQVEIIASNLDSPRGMAFGPDGNLYIAEAGRGPASGFDPSLPTIPSPSVPGAQLQFGTTGAIARLTVETGTLVRVLTGLPSVAIPDDATFGPAAGTDALGPNDLAFGPDGLGYLVLGLGSDPANREVLNAPEFGGLPTQLGTLASVDLIGGGSSLTILADLAAFEGANNPDGADVNTNPYSLVIQEQTILALDAGANTLLSTDLRGNGLALETVFGEIRVVPNPGIPGPPPQIPMQQVPTAVVVGPENDLFVSELTGFPFPVGLARILRVNGATTTLFQEGFTTLIDFDFDAEGNLWALEYDSDSPISGDPFGSLIRVSPSGSRTTILEDLENPTAVVVGADGAIYVANQGFFIGEGEILQITFE